MTTVSDAITNLQNATAQSKAQEEKVYSNKVTSGDFLYLLTQQLQYQDPMNPMDNSEMLAQEAQFSTLEQMEALTSSFSKFSNVYQANSLMGQKVEVKDGDSKATGKVEYVDMTDTKGASISINGKLYPLSSVTKVYPEDTTEIDKQNTEDRNFLLNSIYFIGTQIGNISEKVNSMFSGNTPETEVPDDNTTTEQ